MRYQTDQRPDSPAPTDLENVPAERRLVGDDRAADGGHTPEDGHAPEDGRGVGGESAQLSDDWEATDASTPEPVTAEPIPGGVVYKSTAVPEQRSSAEQPPAGPIDGLREQWREIQLRFVDDPHDAAGQAQELLDQAVAEYTRAITDRKAELDSWRSADGIDTEQIRLVIRRYRDLLNELSSR